MKKYSRPSVTICDLSSSERIAYKPCNTDNKADYVLVKTEYGTFDENSVSYTWEQGAS